MKERVSNRAIELRVEWLNKALGRPLKPDWGKPLAQTDYDKASFYVDHQLGGYRLECAGNPVFGHQRMTKNELCNQLEAILTAIKLARNEQSGSAWPVKAPDGSIIRPEEQPQPWQPKTGEKCSCRPGIHRDNCPMCEGAGWKIDFKQIRDRKLNS